MEDKKIYKGQVNITGGKSSSGFLTFFYFFMFAFVPLIIVANLPEHINFSSIKDLSLLVLLILGLLSVALLAMTNGGYRDMWFEGTNLAVKNKKGQIKYYSITGRTKMKAWKTKVYVKDMGEMFEYTFVVIFFRLKGFTIEFKNEKEFDELISFVQSNTGRQIKVVKKIDKYFKNKN